MCELCCHSRIETVAQPANGRVSAQKSLKAAPTALSKVPKGRGQPSAVLQPRLWAE